MSLTPQWLDQLRTRITLSQIIGRNLRLIKAGREFKACCPFHGEKTPSFTINDEKGFYHCFGCGAHGDAIRWMMEQNGLSFMDAVKDLASEAGLDVPAPSPRQAQMAKQRNSLHDVMNAAQDWFHANLAAPAGADARSYLADRGLSANIIKEFGFGLAPDSRSALKTALDQFDERMLIEAGLRIAVDGREPYDRFRGRLMLPIQDIRGRIIAFGGRILASEPTDAPKYLNSPETPLFDKGRTLYNLHRAAPASRKTGRLIVVEGYMDVIAMAAAGFGEAVAPLGTALGEQQIEMLWRLNDTPILCLDGDAAGQRAAMRAAMRALPLLQPGRSLRIVHLPHGQDPDDILRHHGAEAMTELLEASASLLDTLWNHERSAQPLATPEDKAGLKARLSAHTETIAHPDIRALYRRELMDRFSAYAFPPRPPRINAKQAGAAMHKRQGGWQNISQPSLSPENVQRLLNLASGGTRDRLATAITAGLLRFPELIPRHAEMLSRYQTPDPVVQEALDSLIDQADGLEENQLPPISAVAPRGMVRAGLHYSFLDEDMDLERARVELSEAIALLVERPALDHAIKAATARFDEDPAGSYAEQQRLMKRKLEIDRRLGQMASERAAKPATNDDNDGNAVSPSSDGHRQ